MRFRGKKALIERLKLLGIFFSFGPRHAGWGAPRHRGRGRFAFTKIKKIFFLLTPLLREVFYISPVPLIKLLHKAVEP